jgi:hypothetical protein
MCIAPADGLTGFLIAELILTNEDFSSKVDSVVSLSLSRAPGRVIRCTHFGAVLADGYVTSLTPAPECQPLSRLMVR